MFLRRFCPSPFPPNFAVQSNIRTVHPALITLAVLAAMVSALTYRVAPAGADGFHTLYSAQDACQEVRTFETAVHDQQTHEVSVPEGPGPIRSAVLEWVGADDLTPNAVSEAPQADSALVVNGNEVVGVQAPGAAGATELRPDHWWFAWSADIGPGGQDLLANSGDQTLEISGWNIERNDENHGRNGAKITVVYDTSPCEQPSDITLLTGTDWVYEEWGKPASSTMVIPVQPSSESRVASVSLTHWGTENRERCRSSSLWMLAGSGELPPATGEAALRLFNTAPGLPATGINNAVEIVENPFRGTRSTCVSSINPAPDVPYADGHAYPEGALSAPYRAEDLSVETLEDSELTVSDIRIQVPAGSSWIALELESEAEHFGESGAWGSGFNFSIPSPSTDSTIPGPTAELETEQTDTSSGLGDLVWIDTNRNGTQDDGEPPVPGIEVRLCDASHQILLTTQTNASGNYLFEGLTPGEYQVQFVVPVDAELTATDVGPDEASDSDGDPANANLKAPSNANADNCVDANEPLPAEFKMAPTPWVALAAGELNLDLDQGIVIEATIPGEPANATGEPAEPDNEPGEPVEPANANDGSANAETPTPTAENSSEPQLALTGSSITMMFFVGLCAIATGLLFVGARRRSRTTSPIGQVVD